jgi:hypothetical protein
LSRCTPASIAWPATRYVRLASVPPAWPWDNIPEQAFFPGGRMDLFLQAPHIHCQAGGTDANRTYLVAGQAIEAGVHLLKQIGAEFEITFQCFACQCHPAAR